MPVKKVTRKEWLWIGVTYFSKGGLKALNVEKMAKSLKCTKGSFYWYFKSREDYIKQLIDLWAAEGTESFIDNTGSEQSPEEKLRKLITEVFRDRRGADFEFYLRHLGQKKPEIKELISKTEMRRIAFMAGLLEEAGIDDSRMKAEIMYFYYLGWYEHNKHIPATDIIIAEALQRISFICGLDL
jgi:AcrR family transcriptional regulator